MCLRLEAHRKCEERACRAQEAGRGTTDTQGAWEGLGRVVGEAQGTCGLWGAEGHDSLKGA